MRKLKVVIGAAALLCSVLSAGSAMANGCPTTWLNLQQKLKAAVAQIKTNDMWAVVVNHNGVVCAVAFSGDNLLSQWLLSRQIAAAKAFTSNGLSTAPPGFKTEALDLLVQPGGSLYGLAAGNPSDPEKIYKGPQSKWGTAQDPMVGEIVGGTITFGGGTPIIRGAAIKGAVGVSGDTAANDQLVSDAVASSL